MGRKSPYLVPSLREAHIASMRKRAVLLPSRQYLARESWAAIGADTSMSSIAVCGIGYCAILDRQVGPVWRSMRWTSEVDYFSRLREAASAYKLVLDLIHDFWVLDPNLVHIAIEEPWYYGAVGKGQSGWLKQQAEIAGVFKGSLLRYGYANLYEINNSQWHSKLTADGVKFERAPRGSSSAVKAAIALSNKFKIKTWAMDRYGMPNLADLVKAKDGSKIVRPETGFGANAKAVQPEDVYDAAAIMAWMTNELAKQKGAA